MKNNTTERGPVVLFSPVGNQTEQDCACSDDGLLPAVLCSRSLTSETDCACPDTGSSSIAPTTQVSAVWKIPTSLYRAPLGGAHELTFNTDCPTGVAVLNEPARDILDGFKNPRPLADDTSRQLASLGLLDPAEGPQAALCPMPTKDTLTAWLHVTNACNLRCDYCYVRADGTPMYEATGLATLETVFSSAFKGGFRAVKLKYAGGEPTLNFDLVRTLHEQACRMAQRRELGLHETLITNGVDLSDEILAFIGDAGMRLAISLDASRQAHDARRTLPDGGGTFAQVCHSIERAVRSGIHPHLSITLCGDRSEDSADAVALALELGLPFNLNFVRPARGPLAPTIGEGLITSVRAAFARIESRPPEYSILAILDRANFARPHRHACGAGRSYLAIDHRGRISPCQMELSQPTCDLTQEEPLAMLSSAFANPAVDERVECSACAWRYSCAGGCPWLTKRAYGHSRAPSPYCAVYRILYPELLRLEGIRLLARHSG